MTQLDLHPSDIAVVAHTDDETLAMGSVVAEPPGRGVVHMLGLSCREAALGVHRATVLSWPDGCLGQQAEELECVVLSRGAEHRRHCLLTVCLTAPLADDSEPVLPPAVTNRPDESVVLA